DISFCYPYFNSSYSILSYSCSIMVVNIRSDSLKRYSTFNKFFTSSDIHSSQSSTNLNLNSNSSIFHHFFNQLLSNSSVRHSSLYLNCSNLCHYFSRKFWFINSFYCYFEWLTESFL